MRKLLKNLLLGSVALAFVPLSATTSEARKSDCKMQCNEYEAKSPEHKDCMKACIKDAKADKKATKKADKKKAKKKKAKKKSKKGGLLSKSKK